MQLKYFKMHKKAPSFPSEKQSCQTADFIFSTCYRLNFILSCLPALSPYLPKKNLIEIQCSQSSFSDILAEFQSTALFHDYFLIHPLRTLPIKHCVGLVLQAKRLSGSKTACCNADEFAPME